MNGLGAESHIQGEEVEKYREAHSLLLLVLLDLLAITKMEKEIILLTSP